MVIFFFLCEVHHPNTCVVLTRKRAEKVVKKKHVMHFHSIQYARMPEWVSCQFDFMQHLWKCRKTTIRREYIETPQGQWVLKQESFLHAHQNWTGVSVHKLTGFYIASPTSGEFWCNCPTTSLPHPHTSKAAGFRTLITYNLDCFFK